MTDEPLAAAFNRAITAHSRGGKVNTLEIKIACAAVLSAYLEQDILNYCEELEGKLDTERRRRTVAEFNERQAHAAIKTVTTLLDRVTAVTLSLRASHSELFGPSDNAVVDAAIAALRGDVPEFKAKEKKEIKT